MDVVFSETITHMRFFKNWGAVFLVAVLMLASCRSKEKELSSTPETLTAREMIYIKASVEQQTPSKTTLQDAQVLWTSGDQIKVFSKGNPSGVVLTLEESSVGSAVGVFSGEKPQGGGPYYVVYPSDAAVSLQDDAVQVSLPAAQTYAEESFGNGANLSMAVSESLQYLVFRNALGGVSFSLSGDQDFSGILLQAKGGEPLSGAGFLKMEESGPVLTMENALAESSSLFLDCSKVKGHTYYLMVPPGSFKEGFMAEFITRGRPS